MEDQISNDTHIKAAAHRNLAWACGCISGIDALESQREIGLISRVAWGKVTYSHSDGVFIFTAGSPLEAKVHAFLGIGLDNEYFNENLFELRIEALDQLFHSRKRIRIAGADQ